MIFGKEGKSRNLSKIITGCEKDYREATIWANCGIVRIAVNYL